MRAGRGGQLLAGDQRRLRDREALTRAVGFAGEDRRTRTDVGNWESWAW